MQFQGLWSGLNNRKTVLKRKNDDCMCRVYFDEYNKFINGNKINDLRIMDKAFFAFGQFLKKYGDVFETH